MDNQENKEEKFPLSSKKKWFWLAIVIALISPVSGVVLAVAFLTEPELKSQGRIILPLAIIWGIIFLYLTNWLISKGYLPV
ncbi:MAG: hypothetical protein ABH889_01430 [Candidatus Portnoybacteria bacterium]